MDGKVFTAQLLNFNVLHSITSEKGETERVMFTSQPAAESFDPGMNVDFTLSSLKTEARCLWVFVQYERGIRQDNNDKHLLLTISLVALAL